MRRKPAAPGPTELAFVEPCLARLAPPPEGDGWVHEIKFDGYRVQAHVRMEGRSRSVRLLTRNGLDWTARFAHLARAFPAITTRSAIIDSEAVVEDEHGVSRMDALQKALKSGNTSAVRLMAFDLMHLDGQDTRPLPLLERKALLASLLREESPDGPVNPVKLSAHLVGPGTKVLAEACRLGLEGVVSKRVDSLYRSGRSGDWIKAKCVLADPFVVAGYVPSRAGSETVGSLVLGYYDGGRLVYAGRVGTGWSLDTAHELWHGLQAIRRGSSALATPLAATQRRDVHWVSPVLVAEVAYRFWTDAGLLRHAVFQHLREDKRPEEIGRPASLLSLDAP
ncbi:MAG: non-homologous end-joining DNA ligase [Hyphomicrobiaceae bacterium]